MRLLAGILDGMKLFGELIATLVNSLLLSVVYIVGVGLTAIIAKLTKKQLLAKSAGWSQLKLKKKPVEEYYRQF